MLSIQKMHLCKSIFNLVFPVFLKTLAEVLLLLLISDCLLWYSQTGQLPDGSDVARVLSSCDTDAVVIMMFMVEASPSQWPIQEQCVLWYIAKAKQSL